MRARTLPRLTLRRRVVLAATAGFVALGVGSALAVVPATPSFGPGIEALAGYDGQTTLRPDREARHPGAARRWCCGPTR